MDFCGPYAQSPPVSCLALHIPVISPTLHPTLCLLCSAGVPCSAWTPAICAVVGKLSPGRKWGQQWGLPCEFCFFWGLLLVTVTKAFRTQTLCLSQKPGLGKSEFRELTLITLSFDVRIVPTPPFNNWLTYLCLIISNGRELNALKSSLFHLCMAEFKARQCFILLSSTLSPEAFHQLS